MEEDELLKNSVEKLYELSGIFGYDKKYMPFTIEILKVLKGKNLTVNDIELILSETIDIFKRIILF